MSGLIPQPLLASNGTQGSAMVWQLQRNHHKRANVQLEACCACDVYHVKPATVP